jgi:hypothetical protein
MKHAVSLACALALGALSAPAFAAEAQGHQAFVRAEIGNTDVDTTISGGGPTISEDDTTAGFGGGYWFNAKLRRRRQLPPAVQRELRGDYELDIFSLAAGVVAKQNFRRRRQRLLHRRPRRHRVRRRTGPRRLLRRRGRRQLDQAVLRP